MDAKDWQHLFIRQSKDVQCISAHCRKQSEKTKTGKIMKDLKIKLIIAGMSISAIILLASIEALINHFLG